MLRWAMSFLFLSLIAAIFGFTGIAGEAVYIARVLFYIFIVLFLVSLLYSAITGKPTMSV